MTNFDMPLLINREGGAARKAGDALSDRISKAFAASGGTVDVQMLPAEEMEKAIRGAAETHKRIIVAGGDGTISAAAHLLAGTETELAILPLGTLNHFARDLGIPSDLSDAAQLAMRGKAQPVDVGEVNGKRFINNASVGLYPFMVKHRDGIRDRRGWPKWLATVPASLAALSRLPHHRLHIDMGHGKEKVVTPLLFVGNNRYSLESGSVGCRDSLRDGELSVYVVPRSGRLALFSLGIRILTGMTDRQQDFETLGVTDALHVLSHGQSLEIALDGEIQRLRLPLDFEILRGGLSVVMPRNLEQDCSAA